MFSTGTGDRSIEVVGAVNSEMISQNYNYCRTPEAVKRGGGGQGQCGLGINLISKKQLILAFLLALI